MAGMSAKRELTPSEKAAAVRLKAIWNARKEAGKPGEFTQLAVAHACGWSNQSAFSQYVNGVIPLNYSALVKLAAVLRFEPHEVSPELVESHGGVAYTPAEPERPPQVRTPVAAYGIRAVDDDDELDPEEFIQIPEIDVHLTAGDGGVGTEFVEQKYTLPFRRWWLDKKGIKPENVKLMSVRGDSMEPYLQAGDTVMIDLSDKRIVDHQVYAIIHAGEPKIKRLRKRYDGGLVIVSDNPSYPDEEVPPDGLEHVVILGRKRWRGG